MSMHTAVRRLAVACALALPLAGLTATVAALAHADVPVVTVSNQTAATEMTVTAMPTDGGGGKKGSYCAKAVARNWTIRLHTICA
jgi:hypothetical protein